MENNKDLIFDLVTIDRIIADYENSLEHYLCFASISFREKWDCPESKSVLSTLGEEFISSNKDQKNFSTNEHGRFLFYLDTARYGVWQEVIILKKNVRTAFLEWLREKIANSTNS